MGSQLKDKKFGISDNFYTEYGSVHDARKYYGLDVDNINKTIRSELG